MYAEPARRTRAGLAGQIRRSLLLALLLWPLAGAADLLEALRPQLTNWLDDDGPGVAVIAHHAGQERFRHASGAASLTHGLTMQPEQRFHAGSIAKMFTAYATLRLAEAGALNLDDMVTDHLRDWPELFSDIRIRDLLEHRAGLPDVLTLAHLAGWAPGEVFTHEQALRFLRRQNELNFAPGTAFGYSNSGYLLLAEIVDRVSGQALPDWLQQEVFEPLGLDATGLLAHPHELVPGLAESYTSGLDGMPRRRLDVRSSALGYGNLVTSLPDLVRWGEYLLQTTLDEQPAWQAMAAGSEEFGFGLIRGNVGEFVSYGHGGALSGYRSALIFLPEVDLVVAGFGNAANLRADALVEEVAQLLLLELGLLLPPLEAPVVAPETPLVEQARDHLGRYRLATGAILRLEAVDEQLFVVLGATVRELRPRADGHLDLAGEPGTWLELRRTDAETPALTLHLADQSIDADVLQASELPARSWRAYSGRYFSPELGVHFVLEQDGDSLVARRERGPALRFKPIAEDRFLEDAPGDLQLTMERSSFGRISGFRLRTGRAQNVQFLRE